MNLRILALAAALAACGGSTTELSNCNVTFSGAVTGSGKCTIAGGNGYKAGGSGNGVGIGMNGTVTGVQSFAFALDLGSTAVATGTYSNTATTASEATTLSGTGNATWIQTSHAGSTPDQGTYTLNLTDLGPGINSNGGTAYAAMHGSLNATLPAVTGTGATGTVTVSATF